MLGIKLSVSHMMNKIAHCKMGRLGSSFGGPLPPNTRDLNAAPAPTKTTTALKAVYQLLSVQQHPLEDVCGLAYASYHVLLKIPLRSGDGEVAPRSFQRS